MQFYIVLVAPARAENVGAVARAMKTMGMESLRIVNSEVHLQPAARWVAHGAGDILDNVQTFATLEAALADVDFTVASTARSRAKYYYYCTPQQLQSQLEEKRSWCRHVALVFGREEYGLTNEELALADLLTSVPMHADYPSLNLGQAVMVYCYQLSSLMGVLLEPELQAEEQQFVALRRRIAHLLQRLSVENDQKLVNWLDQRLGFVAQRDMVMLHTLLNDIEKALDSVG